VDNAEPSYRTIGERDEGEDDERRRSGGDDFDSDFVDFCRMARNLDPNGDRELILMELERINALLSRLLKGANGDGDEDERTDMTGRYRHFGASRNSRRSDTDSKFERRGALTSCWRETPQLRPGDAVTISLPLIDVEHDDL
jgi:hypothetical protein